jgi:hypothetical protein
MDANGQLTFTRASSATRVGPNGYIEKVRENLILQSNTFSNAAWSKLGTTITSGQSDPNGGTSAYKVEIAAGGNNYLYQSVPNPAGEKTISCWIKADSATTIAFGTGGATPNQINVTTTWTRYSFTSTDTTGGMFFGNYFPIVGNPALTFYVFQSQYEMGVMTDYIATTTAAVSVGPVSGTPRLDYLGSDCPRLLLEPQRTNSLLWSENFDNGTWLRGSISVTANSVASPDGYTNADTIANTASTAVYIYQLSQASSATWTGSIFAKKGTNKYLGISLCAESLIESRYQPVFNLENGTLQTENFSGTNISNTSYKIEDYGNGWYRLSATCTFVGGADDCFIVFQHSNNTNYLPSGGSLDWSNATTGNAYLWGAMIEPSAGYSSSYIPTLGTSVTRVADAAYKTGISSLIGQTEGTLFMDFEFKYADGIKVFISIHDSDNSKRIEIWANDSTLYGFVGASAAFNMGPITATNNTRYKAAIAYKSGDSAFYINGTQIAVNNTAFTITLTGLIYDYWGSGYVPNTTVGQTLLFKTRLTNAQLAELTTL